MEYIVITFIENLLTKELEGHNLDVLFSYPEPEEDQSNVLSVLCYKSVVYVS
jgi:hypothetical protein